MTKNLPQSSYSDAAGERLPRFKFRYNPLSDRADKAKCLLQTRWLRKPMQSPEVAARCSSFLLCCQRPPLPPAPTLETVRDLAASRSRFQVVLPRLTGVN